MSRRHGRLKAIVCKQAQANSRREKQTKINIKAHKLCFLLALLEEETLAHSLPLLFHTPALISGAEVQEHYRVVNECVLYFAIQSRVGCETRRMVNLEMENRI